MMNADENTKFSQPNQLNPSAQMPEAFQWDKLKKKKKSAECQLSKITGVTLLLFIQSLTCKMSPSETVSGQREV